MNIYTDRCIKREKAINTWLIKNNAGIYLEKLQQLLASLPRQALLLEFTESIKTAIEFCIEHPEIHALDYQWDASGGCAFAYGLDGYTGEDSFSNSDLGPKELPPLESSIEHEDLIEEDFSDLSVFNSLDLLTNHLEDEVSNAITQKNIPEDSYPLLVDIW